MPAQLRRKRRRRILVQVREHLGVAAAAKPMPVGREPAAQVVVVVQLAVLHRPDRAVLVRERLVTAVDVDDGQPPHAERDAVRAT